MTTETESDSYDDSRLIALESESSQNRGQLVELVAHLEKVESHLAEIDREKSAEIERLRCYLETTNKDLKDSCDKRITTESELNLARLQIDKLAEQVKTLQREKEELEQKCKSQEKGQIVQVHRETSTTLSPQPVTEQPLRMSQSVYVHDEQSTTADLMLSAMSQSVHNSSNPIAQHFHVLDNFQKDSPVCVVYNQGS